MHMIIVENEDTKKIRSGGYNYNFDKHTGFFMRWGRKPEENPEGSIFGPEIADIEISTICSGSCRFCYKSNTSRGTNMSLEMFTKIFNKLPRVLTQIAFGIGDIDSNPDMWKIFQYTRDHAVVPNVTINGRGITKKHALNLKKYCGAVAVSRYDKDNCYDTVKILTDVGLKQTNIHMLLSEETYDTCFEVLDDRENDKRLKDLNAIVFLTLKPKGRGKNMKPLKSVEKYKKLIEYALNRNIPIGFDSCSVPLFLKSVEDSKQYALYNQIAEPCESTLFSVYINVDGEMFPCSFLEDATFEGIDVLNTENFLKDIWFHPRTKSWRKQLLETGKKKDCMVKECRQCPVFDIY